MITEFVEFCWLSWVVCCDKTSVRMAGVFSAWPTRRCVPGEFNKQIENCFTRFDDERGSLVVHHGGSVTIVLVEVAEKRQITEDNRRRQRLVPER
jgi:hypothetical protein